MTVKGILQIVLYLAVLLALVKPLGTYMARVYEGKSIGLDRVLGPLERLIYRLCGIRPEQEMDWKQYVVAKLLFNAFGLLAVYALIRLQGILPLNPQGMGPGSPDLSFNTAVSFATNTNWQAYGGETTMSYLTQMLGMTVQNFLSAATGMAVLVAFIRGLVRHSAQTIGNFWVDMTRTTLYILMPLSLVLALVLLGQGVLQNLSKYRSVPLLQPVSYDQPKVDAAGDPVKDPKGNPVTEKVTVPDQVLAMGPVASQLAIKHLGTNGGGFFNANAAHPFESPTPFTDFLLVVAQTAIAAALCYTFGLMVGDTRQGWAVLAAMLVILVSFMFLAYGSEARSNPRLAALGVDQRAGDLNPGGNMEGKEVRFGVARSAIFATATTATSCGAVDAMHDSFTPLGGLVPLSMMMFSETILGGVGSGLYGMLVFAIVAVFIAGLMVGRTPEYLGKKIEAYEMKMASLVVLLMPLTVLAFTAVGVVGKSGLAGIANPGAHGFSEILYAYTSQGNNNGSAFAGLNANTPFYNVTGAFAMLLGRYWLAIPTLAIAGALARKRTTPAGPGTFPTHTPLFVVLLISVVIVIGALVFFPALALGPIVEHLMMTG
jgi:potassium-transporting ATPase potassium-binding subunit